MIITILNSIAIAVLLIWVILLQMRAWSQQNYISELHLIQQNLIRMVNQTASDIDFLLSKGASKPASNDFLGAMTPYLDKLMKIAKGEDSEIEDLKNKDENDPTLEETIKYKDATIDKLLEKIKELTDENNKLKTKLSEYE